MKTVFKATTRSGKLGIEVKQGASGRYSYMGQWGAGSGLTENDMKSFLNITLRAHPMHVITVRDANFWRAKSAAKPATKLKNPPLSYGKEAEASEIAGTMRWKLPIGDAIHKQVLIDSKKAGFNAEKYGRQIGAAHGKEAGKAYWGKQEPRFGSTAVYRRSGELFVENVLDGSFD